MIRRVRGLFASLVLGGAAVASCSSGSDSATTTTLASALLPGESRAAAYNRFLDECMEKYGYPYTPTNSQVDGETVVFRVYDADPVVQGRQDECIKQATQLVGGRKLTAEQLEENWRFQVGVEQCLIDKGYDMGVLVSLEEFVASGGAVDVASKISEFGGLDQPNADADRTECVDVAG